MRCLSCDIRLNGREATRKYASAENTYIDLCNKCFSHVAEDIPDVESETIADFKDNDVEEAVRNWDYQQGIDE